MARVERGTDKNNVENIATPKDNDGKLKSVALLRVNSSGQIEGSETQLKRSIFLINPSTYEESKSANWAAQQVPGQSDPIYQWVSSGPRQISFEALVTRDSIHYEAGAGGGSLVDSLVDTAANVVGGIASQLAGVTLPPVGSLFPGPDPGAGTQLSIVDKLNYYRSLLYPIYTEGYAGLGASPPLLVLAAGRSIRGKISGSISAPSGLNDGGYIPAWILTNLNIRITKQLPNLDPMEAMVTFTLNEYPIKPISSGNFSQVEVIAPAASGGGLADLLGGLFG